MKHTKTPWFLDNQRFIKAPMLNSRVKMIAEVPQYGMVSYGVDKVNAEYIVKCCNLHNKFVETLELVRVYIENADPNPNSEL